MAQPYNCLETSSCGGSNSISIDGGLDSVIHSFAVVAGSAVILLVIYRLGLAIGEYTTSLSPQGKADAKRNFLVAITGLVIGMLMTGTILYINPAFINLKWDALKNSTASNTNTDSNSKPVDPPIKPTGGGKDIQAMLADEARTRAQFQNAGISINNSACTKEGQTGCTSVGGLAQTTINKIIALKGGCGCNITISGGTEWWLHNENTAHRPGGTAVDLRHDPALDAYIRRNCTPPNSTRCVMDGLSYLDEGANATTKTTGAHWHVQ